MALTCQRRQPSDAALSGVLLAGNLRMHPGLVPHLYSHACRSWTRMALTRTGQATCPSCPTWRPA